MPLLRLTEEQVAEFQRIPEHAMDMHLIHGLSPNSERSWSVVIGCSILMIPDEEAREQISTLLREGREIWKSFGETARKVFEEWRNRLRPTSALPAANNLAKLVVQPIHRASLPRPAPSVAVYGHLPFAGTTQVNEVYYRCECWPISRRVDLGTRKVLAGTFAFPASELSLVPSGFAAVGRYALPDLPPACTRYELQPPVNTSVDCGASVPLFGQAGGGVEVCFQKDFTNVGAIANPILLPVM